MARKQLFQIVLILIVWILTGGQRLLAVPVTAIVEFGKAGDVQSFVGQGTGTGTILASGGGSAEVFVSPGFEIQPFSIAPVSHSVVVLNGQTSQGGVPGVALDTSPASIRVDVPVEPPTVPPTKTKVSVTRFDFAGGQVADMRELDVNFTNGESAAFALSQVIVNTDSNNGILKAVPVDVVGKVGSLQFDQTGAASIVPTGPGMGTFSIPGDLSLRISNIKALIFQVLEQDIAPQTVHAAIDLKGSYKITGPQHDAKIELDGSADNIPYLISTQSVLSLKFGDDFVPLTVQGSIDVVTSLELDFSYHLSSSHLVIPEPGSIVLLAIGLGVCSLAAVTLPRVRRP